MDLCCVEFSQRLDHVSGKVPKIDKNFVVIGILSPGNINHLISICVLKTFFFHIPFSIQLSNSQICIFHFWKLSSSSDNSTYDRHRFGVSLSEEETDSTSVGFMIPGIQSSETGEWSVSMGRILTNLTLVTDSRQGPFLGQSTCNSASSSKFHHWALLVALKSGSSKYHHWPLFVVLVLH